MRRRASINRKEETVTAYQIDEMLSYVRFYE
jgi:hypothetical protein